RSQLAKAKQQVAAAIADEKRLQAQAEQEKKLADDWEKRAMLAVQEGRDDLAKQALLRHAEHMQNAQQLEETWRKHAAETESLEGDQLQKRFAQLEYKADADTQLLQLKQKMGLLGAGKGQAKQIGAGQGDVHDAELVDEDEPKPGA